MDQREAERLLEGVGEDRPLSKFVGYMNKVGIGVAEAQAEWDKLSPCLSFIEYILFLRARGPYFATQRESTTPACLFELGDRMLCHLTGADSYLHGKNNYSSLETSTQWGTVPRISLDIAILLLCAKPSSESGRTLVFRLQRAYDRHLRVYFLAHIFPALINPQSLQETLAVWGEIAELRTGKLLDTDELVRAAAMTFTILGKKHEGFSAIANLCVEPENDSMVRTTWPSCVGIIQALSNMTSPNGAVPFARLKNL